MNKPEIKTIIVGIIIMPAFYAMVLFQRWLIISYNNLTDGILPDRITLNCWAIVLACTVFILMALFLAWAKHEEKMKKYE